jgi:hypothetical protein
MRPKLDPFTEYVNQQLKRPPSRRAFPINDMSFMNNLKYVTPNPNPARKKKIMVNSTDTLLINNTDNFLIS